MAGLGVFPSPCIDRSDGSLIHPCLGHIKQFGLCSTVRVVPPHHEIFTQGDTVSFVYFLCNGFVKLTRTESCGQRVIVGLRRTGWLMGAINVVSGEPYACTVETLVRSRLCVIPKERLEQAMETNASLSNWVATMFGKALYADMIRFSERSCFSGRQRLEKFLLEMVNSMGAPNLEKAVKLPILLKRWEVAQLLAITPQYLSRLITQMENEGYLERRNGWLILPDPKRLFLFHTERSPSSSPN